MFCRFLLTLWLLPILSFAAFADTHHLHALTDDELVQRLERLRLQTFAFKAKAQSQIDEIFGFIKRDDKPKAWLKAYALASHAIKKQLDSPRYDQVMEEARKVGDPHLLAEIHLSHALQLRGDEAMDHALQELKTAEQLARVSGDVLLTGMILAETAYTYSIFHNRHGGIQAIEEALALMQKHQDHPHYLYAQSTLSILLYYLERNDEALRVSQHVFGKFSEQKNYYSAAIEACNIGLAYQQIEAGSAEAIKYFDAAIALATQSGDQDALGAALNGKAHAYLEGQPARAIPLLVEVVDIYRKAGDRIFETESILTLAEAYLNTGAIQKARETLDLVPPNPTFGKIYTERTLDLKSRIAAADQNFEAAYQAHVAYHDYWETRKKEEEKAELNKLASSLNLRIEEEKNRTLQVELGSQQLVLEKTRKEKQLLAATLGLFSLIVAAMLWGLWQGYQVRRQKKLLQEIMDSVHEGIVRFGADRRIAQPYSRHLEQLLGQPSLNGTSLLELLLPAASEQKSMVETCLDAIIGEDRAAWEFNSVHLPAEIHLRDRMVQLYWHPIPNRMGMTEYVMLVLRDVTEQRNYEALLQNERHERDLRNVKTLELRQANFLQVERFLQRVAQSNQARIPALPPATELLRVLHTWKGEARTLGLKSLAAEIHGLEDVWSQGAVGNAKERLETLQVMVKDYLSLLDDPLLHAHGVRKISLSSVCQDLFHEAQTRLLTEGIAWGEIKMVDAIPTWTEARADLVRAILLHAISNSIDHGFIRAPAEFRARVKVELETEVRIMDTELVINLYDNGQGIQWDRIQELAASRGVVAQTRDELQHVLFSDGFSSADQMSLSSGRGVGLAAIQGICEEQGGRASLRDRPEQNGAHLEVRLPVNPGAESIVSAAS